MVTLPLFKGTGAERVRSDSRIQNILSRSSSFCKLSGSEMLDLLIEISGIDFKYTDAILKRRWAMKENRTSTNKIY